MVTIGVPRLTPCVRLLIIACVGVWFFQVVSLRGFGLNWAAVLGLVPDQVIRGFVWQPLTYMFLHSPQVLLHLLFNMLMLWMLGGDVERQLGSRPFLRYYLACGVGAGLSALGLGLLSEASRGVPTVGASGAIFGLVVAYGLLFGDRPILFMMMFPMKARTFAWIMFAIAFFSTWEPGEGSGVSHVAHLGGAVTGFLYLKRGWNPAAWFADLRWRLRRRRFRVLGRRDDDYPFH